MYNFLETNNVAHFHITIPYEVMRRFNKLGLIYKGSPYYGWLIECTLSNKAGVRYEYWTDNIWGGCELEYGGTTKNKTKLLIV